MESGWHEGKGQTLRPGKTLQVRLSGSALSVRLAHANISGAMMIQPTIPTAFGLFFTPWLLDRSLVLAGVVTLAAVIIFLLAFRTGRVSKALLSSMAIGCAIFAVLLVVLPL